LSVTSAQERQKVHSNEQIVASGESFGQRGVLAGRHARFGLTINPN